VRTDGQTDRQTDAGWRGSHFTIYYTICSLSSSFINYTTALMNDSESDRLENVGATQY